MNESPRIRTARAVHGRVYLQMRRAGMRHRGGRTKAYQVDTLGDANEDAAVRRKQMRVHPTVHCSKAIF